MKYDRTLRKLAASSPKILNIQSENLSGIFETNIRCYSINLSLKKKCQAASRVQKRGL